MDDKRKFAIRTFLAVVLVNAILITGIFVISGNNLAENTVPVILFGIVLTLILWSVVWFIGKQILEKRVETPATTPVQRQTETLTRRPAPPELPEAKETGAVQLLSILQRQGRLIDFLQENLDQYEDAQIGAAVRNIHEGCKKALSEHVKLEPVFEQQEGSTVTLQAGFDANAIRLIGNVTGEPPFMGQLRHKGWRVKRVDLPERTQEHTNEMIVAPAEVEIGS